MSKSPRTESAHPNSRLPGAPHQVSGDFHLRTSTTNTFVQKSTYRVRPSKFPATWGRSWVRSPGIEIPGYLGHHIRYPEISISGLPPPTPLSRSPRTESAHPNSRLPEAPHQVSGDFHLRTPLPTSLSRSPRTESAHPNSRLPGAVAGSEVRESKFPATWGTTSGIRRFPSPDSTTNIFVQKSTYRVRPSKFPATWGRSWVRSPGIEIPGYLGHHIRYPEISISGLHYQHLCPEVHVQNPPIQIPDYLRP